MYELVKKKSLGIRILLGILILFGITTILKMFLPAPGNAINEDLMKMAGEINQHTPIVIDSVTRLDNVITHSGNTLQYNYSLLNVTKSDVDTTYLIQSSRQNLLNRIQSTPNMSFFRDNDIDVWGVFYDSSGVYVCTVRLSHEEIKQ